MQPAEGLQLPASEPALVILPPNDGPFDAARTTPASASRVDMEEALLATFLRDSAAASAAVSRVGGMATFQFSTAPCRRIANAIAQIVANGGSADLVLVRDALKDVDRDLVPDLDAALQRVAFASTGANPANARLMLDSLRTEDQKQKLREVGEKLLKVLPGSVDAALEVLRDEAGNLTSIAGGRQETLPFCTIEEVVAHEANNPRRWLLPGVIPFGAISLLLGTGKLAGKSTLTWAMIAAAVRGEDLFGRPLTCGPVAVVVLTEESTSDIAEKVARLGLDPTTGAVAVVPIAACPRRPVWAEAVAAAIAKCNALRATGGFAHVTLIIDTWARWARLQDENQAGPVLDALAELEPARREGMAVLLLHHPSKAEGRSGGNASRGTSALPGEVDVTIELRNERKDSAPNQRRLHVESRATGVFDTYINLIDADPNTGAPAHYEPVGDTTILRHPSTDRRILDFIAARPGCLASQIETGCGVRRAAVQKALPRLTGERKVHRSGAGKAGSPFTYWRAEEPIGDGESPSPPRSLPSPSGGSERQAGGSLPLPPPPLGGGGGGGDPTRLPT